MTTTDLQREKAVAELLEILKTSRNDKELETLMALVTHVNAVKKRLDKALGKLDSVKQKLDASKVSDTVKEAHAGVIANMQKHINHLKDMLGGLRDKIVQAATQAVDNFKQTGKTGLHSVLQGLNVRGSLEQMEKPYGSLVITISMLVAQILNSSSEIQKKLDVSDFKKGEINTKVKSLDGAPLLPVPSARMKTEYIFKDGSAGQEEGGFAEGPSATDINWIITPRSVPIAASKTDKIRIFGPDTNQKADAWKLDYRKYHDAWIWPNKVKR